MIRHPWDIIDAVQVSHGICQELAVLLQHIIVKRADAQADGLPTVMGPEDEASAFTAEAARVLL